MLSKNDILNNLREYTSDQIVEAINNGIVTMYELSKSGNLTPIMRRRIEKKLNVSTEEENAATQKEKEPADTVSTPKGMFDGSISIKNESPSASRVAYYEELLKDTYKIVAKVSNKGMFKRPFSVKGRIRRSEYWISLFIFILLSGIITVLQNNIEQINYLYIPALWFLWAQGTKRCHDIDNNGLYQLIPLYVLLMLFKNSEEEENEYGESPK